ncbi:D-lactate dehydrogenase (cytochrome) [Sulfobacillus acidophilus DSM 10332]|uniref:D-lactate dehydrogenase (Cytochrome) n=1 Tax=Sulfobacillus acidophilus (strain ATCC 700253 / DSM 10332 / NAL) TaxID=679936 RepID=G8U040_SULAD|nr:D-lactate dehydrogenase (cytochrome) [Sulfobacillus acidophilus DSM 10332]
MASTHSLLLWGARERETLIGDYPRPTPATREAFLRELAQTVPPDILITAEDQLLAYSYDATGERHRPDAVLIPREKEQVVAAVKLASARGIPVISRGAGTNLSGGTIPIVGGLVISFARMNRVVRLEPDNRRVTVEPGIVNAELQELLAAHGLTYAPDPSSHRISTIGGNLAENSGGPHCVKYGVTANHVLDVEVVLADGELLRLPATGDWRSGYDLTGILVGSEGTLGLIVEATLMLSPLPQAKATLLAIFSSLDQAMHTVSRIVAARIIPAALELMDRISIEIVEQFAHAGYPAGADAVLLIELDGTPEQVERDRATVAKLAAETGATEVRQAASPEAAEALWRGRRAHYGAAARLAPRLWVQDVTVPRPLLPTMMREVLDIADRHGVTIVTAAHAGDGNLHPTIPYDPDNAEQVRRMRAADHDILQACVKLGGAITGEHGIGVDKVEHLALMYNADELDLMMGVKRAWDPKGLLNPFKAVLDPRHGTPAPHAPNDVHWFDTPTKTEEVVESVIWAVHQEEPITIQGTARRHRPVPDARVLNLTQLNRLIDLDQENLTVDVEAGMPAGQLARRLAAEGFDLPGIEPFLDETVGGLIASNARYWRQSWGLGWRDDLLAVEWVDGQGRVHHFGRKTMKNVAGYDMVKLAVGSRGQLGVITRVSLKLRPADTDRWLAASPPAVAEDLLCEALALAKSPYRPPGMVIRQLPDEALPRLWLVMNGAQRTLLAAQLAHFEWIPGEDAWLQWEQDRIDRLYQAIRQEHHQSGWLKPDQLAQVFETAPSDTAVYAFVAHGGYDILGAPEARETVSPSLKTLQDRLRHLFDPHGIFH